MKSEKKFFFNFLFKLQIKDLQIEISSANCQFDAIGHKLFIISFPRLLVTSVL